MKIKNLAFIILLTLTSGVLFSQNQYSLGAKTFNDSIAKKSNKIILDVRTAKEFAEGHLPDAVNYNWNDADFTNKAKTLDKNKNIYVYCLSGGRSAKAAASLRAEGFTVYEMEGGLLKWRAAGLPVNNIAKDNEGITVEQFLHLINTTDNKKVLVDFYAEWCGPCKLMEPYLKDIDKNMKDKVTVVRIDADKNPDLMAALQIDALPVLQIYKNGKLRWHYLGYINKKGVLKQLNSL